MAGRQTTSIDLGDALTPVYPAVLMCDLICSMELSTGVKSVNLSTLYFDKPRTLTARPVKQAHAADTCLQSCTQAAIQLGSLD